MEVVNEMEKIIKIDKYCILWLTYQQGKIFEKLKENDRFMNLVGNFNISRSTMVFKISTVKFLNRCPKMKKLSRRFLKNDFKIIKETCHENASEFKYKFLVISFKIIL